MALPRPTVEQLLETAQKLPAIETVKAFPTACTLLNRLGAFLQKEALLFKNNFPEVERRLTQSVPQDAYKGIILEYLLEMLGDVGHRPEAATMMRCVCQSLMSTYNPDIFPVRRLR
jgi:hypothetical protein